MTTVELLSVEPLWWLASVVALALALRFTLVDQPAWRRALSLVFRALAVFAIVIGLCRPYWLTPTDRVHVVFLVDASESIDLSSLPAAAESIDESIDRLESGDSWSLFLFGSELRRLNGAEELTEIAEAWGDGLQDDAFRGESKIAHALLEARLAFPAGVARRMVVFTDGRGTDAGITQAIGQLADERIDLRFAEAETLQDAEALVESLEPASAVGFRGEVARFRASVRANRDMESSVRLVHNGVVMQRRRVQLRADEPCLVEFDAELTSTGSARYTVEIEPQEDRFPINNRAGCAVEVRGDPRVLVLHREPREMRPISRALGSQGVETDVRGRLGTPNSLQELLAFDAVVIADLSATDLSARQMQMIKRYVIDYGGGLVMLGSENSFGLGGYYKTPIEEVLPLVSRFEKEKEKPSLAMVLVIDKSGSMQGMPISLARQAAKSAVELLSVRDLIGVVGFDGMPQVVSELRSAADAETINVAIDSLEAGGGTYLYPAMRQACEMLEAAPAKIRHMIVLSDGYTQPADHSGLAQEAADLGITVSTVALGGADKALLSGIADVGRGRYYETDDPLNVPQIFTKETMQASKSAIKEDLFAAVVTSDHPALSGVSEADLPFSLGYVMTAVKPTAQLLLAAETGDPLLASGRYGLGAGMAFASDLTERWGGEWLAWENAGRFWAQMFRSVLRRRDSAGIAIESTIQDDRWTLRVERSDSSGRPTNRVRWQATASDEQSNSRAIAVEPVGIGRYRAEIDLPGADRMSVRLLDADSGDVRVVHWRRAYPAEYALSQEPVPSVSAIPEFSVEGLREGIPSQPRRTAIAHHAYLVAIALTLVGLVLRRL